MSLPVFTVYSRPGCHLCEQLVEELLPMVRERASVEVLDIDSRPEWTVRYGLRIPVLELRGTVICELHLDRPAVGDALARIGD